MLSQRFNLLPNKTKSTFNIIHAAFSQISSNNYVTQDLILASQLFNMHWQELGIRAADVFSDLLPTAFGIGVFGLWSIQDGINALGIDHRRSTPYFSEVTSYPMLPEVSLIRCSQLRNSHVCSFHSLQQKAAWNGTGGWTSVSPASSCAMTSLPWASCRRRRPTAATPCWSSAAPPRPTRLRGSWAASPCAVTCGTGWCARPMTWTARPVSTTRSAWDAWSKPHSAVSTSSCFVFTFLWLVLLTMSTWVSLNYQV